ncbi:MAG: hypothetical protein INH13_00910 [Cupriavidus sp.]|nr:hypothetical protein [Cupriavidus sp.]
MLSSLVLGRYAIRDVFLDIQLQGRLTSAASFDAELIRNALRLHPTERRDLAIRLLRVKCKTYPVSQDDLDVLFKLYWRGLKAELQRVPRASTSAEQIEAAKFSIVREIYRYLADHPVDLEHFIREEASGREFSYSDISCLVERIIEAAPSRLDAHTVAAVFELRPGKTAFESRMRLKSEKWQAFLRRHYSSEAMPALIRSQLEGYESPLPFREIHIRRAVTWTTNGKSRTSLEDETCIAQEGTLVRCVGDHFVEGIEPRYMTNVYFGAPLPWIYKTHDDFAGLPAQHPTFMALAAGAKLPQRISPNSEFAFRTVQWSTSPGNIKRHQSIICRSGARYAANQIHADLPGMAIDLDCTVKEDGKVVESQTLAYLEDLGVVTYLKITTPDSTTALSILAFSMDKVEAAPEQKITAPSGSRQAEQLP